MVHKKRKKNVKMRGSMTHGWGAKKKHRGAGNRGGKGNAGSGKRADAKKPTYDMIPNYRGKHGFVGSLKEVKTINIATIEEQFQKFISEKSIEQKEGAYVMDLSQRYDKLLGSGHPTRKYKITVPSASSGAVEKITSAGGSVTTTKTSDKKAVAE
ncbi:uL15 family ribosomal protein [Candidatus Woesearchaeota archaeon]|nr:uL15 family ribosomal protein [Candidatus Woesearchaeota archaeon]